MCQLLLNNQHISSVFYIYSNSDSVMLFVTNNEEILLCYDYLLD